MKIAMIKKKHILHQVNSRLDVAGGSISKPEDITIETIQHETQREKELKNYKGSVLITLQDNFVQPNIHAIGISEGEIRQKGR